MGEMVNVLKEFVVVALIASFTGFSLGQTGTTSLRGTVSDSQGAVIPAATATLSNPATGFSRATQTDDHGFYQFLQVTPGTYTLTVAKSGFGTMKEEGLQLQVDVPATSNLTMRVQAEASTVEVMSTTVQVNSEDATIGNAFGASQIESLPFEGRDPTQILSLQPGVTYVGSNVDQNQDSRGGSVSGARSDQTNITLDGVDDNDQVKGYAFQGALRSTLDSLQEFRVTTSNANADEGRSSGAQVALVTKSGTNSFHGSLYEYHRPTFTTANDWFNKQAELGAGLPNIPGKVVRNTFGGSVGGAIKKDRTFFFFSYEGFRSAETQQVTREIPTLSLRQGFLRYLCDTSLPNCDPSNPTVNVQNVPGLGLVATLTPAQVASLDTACGSNCPLGGGPNPLI